MNMRTPLSIRIPHGDEEPPTSLLSRLAALHGCTFNEFCLDMAVAVYDVIHGRDQALSRLETLAGLPSGRILPFSIRRAADGFTLNGHAVRTQSLRRKQIYICPVCVANDLHTQPGPALVRPYARTSWILTSIRSCAKHRTALIALQEPLKGVRAYDFSRAIFSATRSLERVEGLRSDWPRSPFEDYLLGRLWGPNVEVPLLGSMPWYAAAQSCEVVGAVSLAGPGFRPGEMSDRDWFDAGIEGFSILSEGEASFRTLLSRLQSSFRASKRNWGPGSLFGRLYSWLSSQNNDRAYGSLREIMKRHMAETLPLGPGDKVFGEAILVRRLHSVRTATLETGRHPKRLRKLLLDAELIREADLGLTDDRILFQADSVGNVLTRAAEAMSLTSAGKYLNAPRVQVQKLHEQGIIRPFVKGGRRARLSAHAFSRAELDRFLERLIERATLVSSPPPGTANIPEAAKRACCSAMEIVRLVIEHRLSWTGRLRLVSGYLSLLVDIDEVRGRVRREDHGGYSLRQVEQLISTTTHAVRALVADGHLPTCAATNPVNRCPQTIVSRPALDSFRATFVSLAELARDQEMSPTALLRKLRSTGISPAIVYGHKKKSYFFLRTTPRPE